MVLTVLVGRVIAGDGDVATLAATLAVAPIVALLAVRPTSGADTGRPSVPDVVVLVASVLILVANLIALGDLARGMGVARAYGIGGGALLAALIMAGQRADREWRLAAPLGALLVMAPIGFVIASVGAPWTTWSIVASRPALTFDAGSPWVTRGEAFGEPTHLTFHEPHRVVAASPATWRVIERDVPRAVVREWRLGMGDALTLRPGDELALEAGARVRFEAGRRIPGAPASGIAWADGRTGPTRPTSLAGLALVATLVAGALGLVCGPAHGVRAADDGGWRAAIVRASVPLLVLLFIAGATMWGVYGVALAPELALAPSALACLAEVTTRLVPAWSLVFQAGAAAGIALLFVGSLLAWPSGPSVTLRGLATGIGSKRSAAVATIATVTIVALAAVLALYDAEAWHWFVAALGLAASASAAPRLAMAGRRGEVVGALVGAVVFGIVFIGPDAIPGGLKPLGAHPALLAAPLAWATARLARSRGRARRARAGSRATAAGT